MKRCRPASSPNSRSAPVPLTRTSARARRGCVEALLGPRAIVRRSPRMVPARLLLAPQVHARRASRGGCAASSTSLTHATDGGARVGRVDEHRDAGPLRPQAGEQPEQIAAKLAGAQRSRRRSDRSASMSRASASRHSSSAVRSSPCAGDARVPQLGQPRVLRRQPRELVAGQARSCRPSCARRSRASPRARRCLSRTAVAAG